MKIYTEKTLRNFDFWAGAVYTSNHLTMCELDMIENMLEDINPDGMDETEINDFFWFKDDTIANWLDYPDFETLVGERENENSEMIVAF